MICTRLVRIVGLAVLWVAVFSPPDVVLAVDPKQEAETAEGAVGSRAAPMQRQNPLGIPIPVQPGVGIVPPPPPSCLKTPANPPAVSPAVPPTQYYTVMPSSIDVRSAVRVAFDDLVDFMFGNFLTYIRAIVTQKPANLDKPPFRGSIQMNAPIAGIYAVQSENPPQSELIGDAQIHLPHGAMIREISIGVRDNSNKQNLHAELQGSIGDGRGFVDLIFESDCLAVGTYGKMAANNLAIPVDGRYGHFVRLTLVPAKTPVTLAPGTAAVIQVDLITIGYTLP